MVAGNPFLKETARDPSHLVVVFLKESVEAKAAKGLEAAITGPEEVRAAGRESYAWYPAGIGTSKLTNALIERKLGVRGTARNWNTVKKLVGMVDSGAGKREQEQKRKSGRRAVTTRAMMRRTFFVVIGVRTCEWMCIAGFVLLGVVWLFMLQFIRGFDQNWAEPRYSGRVEIVRAAWPIGVTVCSLAAVALGLHLVDRLILRRIGPSLDACVECGYCLIGNEPGRCPECGTEVTHFAESNATWSGCR